MVYRMSFILVALLAAALFLFQSLFLIKDNDIIKLNDQAYYYSYVRSALIDKDFNFVNEYNYFNFTDYKITKEGLPSNRYSIGFPLMVYPFYAAAHLSIPILNTIGLSIQKDGYSKLHQLSFCLGSIFYGIIGLYLCFLFLRKYYTEKVSSLSILILVLTTNIFYYYSIEPFMSELCSFFSVTLFLYLWQRTLTTERKLLFFGLGLAAGLMIIVRQQNAAFLAIVPIGYLWSRGSLPAMNVLNSTALIVGGILLGLVPQLFAWNEIFGSVVVDSYRGYSFTYKYEPKILQVLFSTKHGLISWHPVILLCLTGLFLSIRKHARIAVPFIVAFLLQLYIISSWYYWWFGYSFGHRGFVSCTLIFAFGIAYFINQNFVKNNPVKFATFFCLLSFWNMLLILSYLSDMIPKEDYFYWTDLFRDLMSLPQHIVSKLNSL